MAELILTEEEQKEKSYLNFSDESLGKYVKKKAIEQEDYYGENTTEKEAALITMLSYVAEESENDMVMLEVKGLTVEGDDFGEWRVTFEKIDPDVPDSPIDDIDPDNLPDDDDDGEGGVLVP